jgi:serine/threonine protein kinase
VAKVAAEVGSTANRYQILTRLAAGGMAEIFLARGASMADVERYCVLKRILHERAGDAQFVRMFLDEARLAAQLQHPNIAAVYDVGVLGDSYFFTMEYVHGETIRSLLQRAVDLRRPLPLACVLTIIAGAAAGLHHAHERNANDGRPLGIVHRDVSPSNVMVSFEGNVKVVDFGVAKAANRAVETQSGTVKGKISYLSPEQCRGTRVDRRSDLFSLGIVMWEMLTGARLYRRMTDFENMTAIVNEPPPRPSSRRSEIPRAVDDIVLRLLAKSVTERFQTAAEVVEAIEDASMRAGTILSTSAVSHLVRDLCGVRPEPWLELEHDTLPYEAVTLISRSAPTDREARDDVDAEFASVFELSTSSAGGETHELSLSDLAQVLETRQQASPQAPSVALSTTVRAPSPERPASHVGLPVAAPAPRAVPVAPAAPPRASSSPPVPPVPPVPPAPPELPSAMPSPPSAPGRAPWVPPAASPPVASILRSPGAAMSIASPALPMSRLSAGFMELSPADIPQINSTLLGVGAPPASAGPTAVIATPYGLFAQGASPLSDSMSTTNPVIPEIAVTGSDLTPLPALQHGLVQSPPHNPLSSLAITQVRLAPPPLLHIARRRVLAIVFAIVIGVVAARFWSHGEAGPRSDGAGAPFMPVVPPVARSQVLDAGAAKPDEFGPGPDAAAAAVPEPPVAAATATAATAEPSPTPADASLGPPRAEPTPPAATPPPTAPPPPASADVPRRPPPRLASAPSAPKPAPPLGGNDVSFESLNELYHKADYPGLAHACRPLIGRPDLARICFVAACYQADAVQAKHWLPATECGLRESLVNMCKEHGVEISTVPPCAKKSPSSP